ncbi:MAG: hypothetical protein ACT4O1_18210 [Gemmatimonadota bacterium]
MAELLTGVQTLAAGEGAVIAAYPGIRLAVITDTGCTATLSRVDAAGATAHTTGSKNQETIAADTRRVVDIDWPFIRLSAAGGPLRYALV